MPDRKRAAAVTALGLYNVVQNVLVPAPAYVPANLVATAGMLAMARAAGCSWDDLGLDPAKAGRGLALGLGGAALAASVAMALQRQPGAQPYLLDQRAADQGNRDVAYRATVRFPLGTALFEEIAFRGVVPAIWRKTGATQREANLAAATTFGLWHIIPTIDALVGNPLSTRLGYRRSRVGVVATGAVLTGAASLVFSWMRDRSGSLAAPWLAHAAINGATYLVGVAAWRRAAVGRNG